MNQPERRGDVFLFRLVETHKCWIQTGAESERKEENKSQPITLLRKLIWSNPDKQNTPWSWTPANLNRITVKEGARRKHVLLQTQSPFDKNRQMTMTSGKAEKERKGTLQTPPLTSGCPKQQLSNGNLETVIVCRNNIMTQIENFPETLCCLQNKSQQSNLVNSWRLIVCIQFDVEVSDWKGLDRRKNCATQFLDFCFQRFVKNLLESNKRGLSTFWSRCPRCWFVVLSRRITELSDSTPARRWVSQTKIKHQYVFSRGRSSRWDVAELSATLTMSGGQSSYRLERTTHLLTPEVTPVRRGGDLHLVHCVQRNRTDQVATKDRNENESVSFSDSNRHRAL